MAVTTHGCKYCSAIGVKNDFEEYVREILPTLNFILSDTPRAWVELIISFTAAFTRKGISINPAINRSRTSVNGSSMLLHGKYTTPVDASTSIKRVSIGCHCGIPVLANTKSGFILLYRLFQP